MGQPGTVGQYEGQQRLELGMVGQGGRVAKTGSQEALDTARASKGGLIEKCRREVFLSFCCRGKHHDQSILREERVYLVYISSLQCIIKGSHIMNTSRNSSRNCGGRVLTALLPVVSPASCFYRAQAHLTGHILATVIWTLLHQLVLKKTLHRDDHRSI